MAGTTGPEHLGIDYLLLADAAQVQNGKLFLIGGGWDRVQFPSFPSQVPVGVALGVRVPPHDTGVRHTFVITAHGENDQELFKVEGEFELHKPAGTPADFSQLFQIAVQASLVLAADGRYSIEANVDDGKARKTVAFFVSKVPA
jgi:hypothetical protein